MLPFDRNRAIDEVIGRNCWSLADWREAVGDALDKVYIAGRELGADEGYAVGSGDGYFDGHCVGVREGREAGYDEGFRAGYSAAWEAGFNG